MVVVQYTDKISSKKLNIAMREHGGSVQSLKKGFNMRIAAEEVAIKLTGYGNNGVTPIGMLEKVPVIITESISKLEPSVLYLGAGHVDWKISVPVKNLLSAIDGKVWDLSE